MARERMERHRTRRDDDDELRERKGSSRLDQELLTLEEDLRIDQNDLDRAQINQPEAFYRVAKRVAILTSERDAAKQALADAEASADKRVRREAERADEKVTVKEIEARTRLDPEFQRANAEFMRLSYEVARFSALKEAFIQRSYALKDLTAMFLRAYFEQDAASSPGRIDRDALADRGRREMAKQRDDHKQRRRHDSDR